MGELHKSLLRSLPWLLTTFSANVIHYISLWAAKAEAHSQFLAGANSVPPRLGRWYPGSDPAEHEILTFDLMESPTMKKARYKVKLVRYGCTLLCVVLFYDFLPELSLDKYSPGFGTLEALVVGTLSGLVTLYMNENRKCDTRSCWTPGDDYCSHFVGWLWDGVRFAGAFTTPVENGLFYHSWMYRTLVWYFSKDFFSFTEVPFSNWSWLASIVANAAFGLYNGVEWRSTWLVGFLSLWAMSRRGQFLDGILAHAMCRVTISVWVLCTGQRQYW